MKRVLLGIKHSPELYNIVRNTILAYGPSTLGFELPHDFEMRCRERGMNSFWATLQFDVCRNQYVIDGKVVHVLTSIEIISLEDLALYDEGQALMYAQSKLCIRKFSDWNIRELLIEHDKEYVRKMLDRIHDIAAEYNSAKEIEKGPYRENCRARENEMLCNILKHEPNVVVIGNKHAQNLASFLPGYKYNKITTY